MSPKDADRMANCVDTDKTVPSGSTLFAEPCMSKNLGPLLSSNNLRYFLCKFSIISFQFVNPEQSGYVGFANLPNQVHRKSVKRGFEFTLMVVG